MNLAWKVMLPLGLVNFIAIAVLLEARDVYAVPENQFQWTVGIIVTSWIVFAVAWFITAASNPLVADNRPRRNLSRFEVDSQI
jgi:hypothetical protein